MRKRFATLFVVAAAALAMGQAGSNTPQPIPSEVLVSSHTGQPSASVDNTTKIQAAITRAGVGGKVKFDRPGVYVYQTLNVLSGQTIEIPSGVVLRRKANTTGVENCLFKCQDKTNVTFRGGGTLDGNRTGHTNNGAPTYAVANDSGRQCSGIFVLGGSNILIENLTFTNMAMTVDGGDGSGINISTGTGGHTDYAENVTIQNCTFDACTRNATQAGSVLGLKFLNNICKNANAASGDGAGIQLEGEDGNKDAKFTDVLIAGNVMSANKLSVSISNHSAPASNFDRIRIAGNVLRDNTGGNGVYVSKTQGVDIVGNHIVGASAVGIHVIESRGSRVLDNHVSQCTSNGVTMQGCTFFRVAGNEIWRNGANGIGVLPFWNGSDLPCEGIVSGNQCFNNATVDANGAGVFVVPRDAATVSNVKVCDNWFGNNSQYHATPTQKYGWSSRYASADNGFCEAGEYSRNSYHNQAASSGGPAGGANYLTHGKNAIADLDTAGHWQP